MISARDIDWKSKAIVFNTKQDDTLRFPISLGRELSLRRFSDAKEIIIADEVTSMDILAEYIDNNSYYKAKF